MSDVPTAIQEWKDKSISTSTLVRRLVAHDKWSIPMSEAAVAETLATNSLGRILYSKDDAGRSRLLIFSSSETLKTYTDVVKPTEAMHFISSPGTWVFALPLEGIDDLILDPASSHQFVVSGESIKSLAATARAIQLEQTLVRLRAGEGKDGDVAFVAKYPDFHVALSKGEDGSIAFCMAPDTQGRVMAAVFTHEDALDLAFDEMQAHYAPRLVMTMKCDGPKLFGILAGMQLTGMVFNFSGPDKPVAFAAALVGILLEEGVK
jgi:hypothetical protein